MLNNECRLFSPSNTLLKWNTAVWGRKQISGILTLKIATPFYKVVMKHETKLEVSVKTWHNDLGVFSKMWNLFNTFFLSPFLPWSFTSCQVPEFNWMQGTVLCYVLFWNKRWGRDIDIDNGCCAVMLYCSFWSRSWFQSDHLCYTLTFFSYWAALTSERITLSPGKWFPDDEMGTGRRLHSSVKMCKSASSKGFHVMAGG